jgi:CHAT domain-containing protein
LLLINLNSEKGKTMKNNKLITVPDFFLIKHFFSFRLLKLTLIIFLLAQGKSIYSDETIDFAKKRMKALILERNTHGLYSQIINGEKEDDKNKYQEELAYLDSILESEFNQINDKEDSKNYIQIQYDYAKLLYNIGELKKAKLKFERIVSLIARFTEKQKSNENKKFFSEIEALSIQGNAYIASYLGNIKEAREYFDEAEKIYANESKTSACANFDFYYVFLNQKAELLRIIGKKEQTLQLSEEARDCYNEKLKKSDFDDDHYSKIMHLQRGIILANIGEDAKAKESIEASIAISSKNANTPLSDTQKIKQAIAKLLIAQIDLDSIKFTSKKGTGQREIPKIVNEKLKESFELIKSIKQFKEIKNDISIYSLVDNKLDPKNFSVSFADYLIELSELLLSLDVHDVKSKEFTSIEKNIDFAQKIYSYKFDNRMHPKLLEANTLKVYYYCETGEIEEAQKLSKSVSGDLRENSIGIESPLARGNLMASIKAIQKAKGKIDEISKKQYKEGRAFKRYDLMIGDFILENRNKDENITDYKEIIEKQEEDASTLGKGDPRLSRAIGFKAKYAELTNDIDTAVKLHKKNISYDSQENPNPATIESYIFLAKNEPNSPEGMQSINLLEKIAINTSSDLNPTSSLLASNFIINKIHKENKEKKSLPKIDVDKVEKITQSNQTKYDILSMKKLCAKSEEDLVRNCLEIINNITLTLELSLWQRNVAKDRKYFTDFLLLGLNTYKNYRLQYLFEENEDQFLVARRIYGRSLRSVEFLKDSFEKQNFIEDLFLVTSQLKAANILQNLKLVDRFNFLSPTIKEKFELDIKEIKELRTKIYNEKKNIDANVKGNLIAKVLEINRDYRKFLIEAGFFQEEQIKKFFNEKRLKENIIKDNKVLIDFVSSDLLEEVEDSFLYAFVIDKSSTNSVELFLISKKNSLIEPIRNNFIMISMKPSQYRLFEDNGKSYLCPSLDESKLEEEQNQNLFEKKGSIEFTKFNSKCKNFIQEKKKQTFVTIENNRISRDSDQGHFFYKNSHYIFNTLFGKIKEKIKDINNRDSIIIIPDHLTYYIPFNALVVGEHTINKKIVKKYLVEESFNIVLSPSSLIWNGLFTERMSETEKKFSKFLLSFVDSVYSNSNVSFTKQVKESNTISEEEKNILELKDFQIKCKDALENLYIKPKGNSKINLETTFYDKLKSNPNEINKLWKNKDIKEYKTILFFAHALRLSRDDIPVIALSSRLNVQRNLDFQKTLEEYEKNELNKKEMDKLGILAWTDILRYEFKNSLVILAGCSTHTIGTNLFGDMPSLPNAFLISGSSNILSTLWNTDASRTTEIIGLLLKDLKNQDLVNDKSRTTQNMLYKQ